jgi:hypothetical protein
MDQDAGPAHFDQSRLAALGRHGSRPTWDQVNLESRSGSVESGGSDTDILSEPADPDAANSLIAENPRQSGLIERGVLVFVEASALRDDEDVLSELEIRVEGCSGRILNTVDRPLASTFDEAKVLAGVPVSRGQHRNAGIARGQDPAIQSWDDCVPLGDRQGASGTEVVLHVNDHDGVTGFQLASWIQHGVPSIWYLIATR